MMPQVGIITPIKNEADNLSDLIESVLNQSFKPHCWVMVNDGSTDGSEELIQEAVDEYSWIKRVDNDSGSSYEMRANYADVLATGYDYLVENFDSEIDYYMILDGDMRLTRKYLEEIIEFLEKNKEVVITSGGIYVDTGKGLELEARSPMHPAGGATLYEGEFYRDIGGPPLVPGADSATEVKARIRGYECKYLTEADIKAIQSRPTGSKGNVWENAKMRGSNNYILGQRLSVMVLKSIWMCRNPPYYYGIGALAGYLSDLINGRKRVDDEELISYYQNKKPKEIAKNAVILAKQRLSIL